MKLRPTHQAIVKGSWQFLEIKPDVESTRGGNVHVEVECMKAGEDVIPLSLEMPLEGNSLLQSTPRFQQRDGG